MHPRAGPEPHALAHTTRYATAKVVLPTLFEEVGGILEQRVNTLPPDDLASLAATYAACATPYIPPSIHLGTDLDINIGSAPSPLR